MSTLSHVTQALERSWSAIRTAFPDVRPAVLVVYLHPAGDRLGHYRYQCWTQRSFGEADEVHVSSHVLQKGGHAAFNVLLHEAVHSAAAAQGIKDTSRQGRYHNRAFQELAEGMGLVALDFPPHGYAATGLTAKAEQVFRNAIADLDESIDLWQVIEERVQRVGKKKQGRIKLQCPGCQRIIYASAKTIEYGEILCTPCETPFLAE
jgi:hypothetical protein